MTDVGPTISYPDNRQFSGRIKGWCTLKGGERDRKRERERETERDRGREGEM